MPHETTAEVIAPARLKVIPRAAFLNLLSEFPEAGLHSTKMLALEYQKTFFDAKRLALSCSAEARLGKTLLDWGKSVCIDSDLHFQMSAFPCGTRGDGGPIPGNRNAYAHHLSSQKTAQHSGCYDPDSSA